MPSRGREFPSRQRRSGKRPTERGFPRTSYALPCAWSRVADDCNIFMPPVDYLEDYLDLLAAIERTAKELQMPVVIEGYLPPQDDRISNIKVTPDPGVIEGQHSPVDHLGGTG